MNEQDNEIIAKVVQSTACLTDDNSFDFYFFRSQFKKIML